MKILFSQENHKGRHATKSFSGIYDHFSGIYAHCQEFMPRQLHPYRGCHSTQKPITRLNKTGNKPHIIYFSRSHRSHIISHMSHAISEATTPIIQATYHILFQRPQITYNKPHITCNFRGHNSHNTSHISHTISEATTHIS